MFVFFFYFFFFFQAEDGIRDVAVTGVQTCALPISGEGQQDRSVCFRCRQETRVATGPEAGRDSCEAINPERVAKQTLNPRSEERRVGKECRSRWARYH